MDNFLIIGGGKFGLKAANVLRKANSANSLTIVEREKTVCRRLGRLGFEAVCLEGIQYKDSKAIVIRSHQLAPGVGGYKPDVLFEALKKIEATQAPLMISTACSCHGVIHTFKHSAKK